MVFAIAHDGVRVRRKTYLVDMAGGTERTDYVSVSSSVIGALPLLELLGLTGVMNAPRLPEME